MPRTARKISRSNIYHVILRGINRQTIFEDDGDRHYFMTVLQYYKGISGYKLHAFCLMGNHVHLLIEPAGEPLGQVFKRVGVLTPDGAAASEKPKAVFLPGRQRQPAQ